LSCGYRAFFHFPAGFISSLPSPHLALVYLRRNFLYFAIFSISTPPKLVSSSFVNHRELFFLFPFFRSFFFFPPPVPLKPQYYTVRSTQSLVTLLFLSRTGALKAPPFFLSSSLCNRSHNHRPVFSLIFLFFFPPLLPRSCASPRPHPDQPLFASNAPPDLFPSPISFTRDLSPPPPDFSLPFFNFKPSPQCSPVPRCHTQPFLFRIRRSPQKTTNVPFSPPPPPLASFWPPDCVLSPLTEFTASPPMRNANAKTHVSYLSHTLSPPFPYFFFRAPPWFVYTTWMFP